MKRGLAPSAAPILLLMLSGMALLGTGIMPRAHATSLLFSTGSADGLMGTLSRPPGSGLLETETADDFTLSSATTIDHATFVGLLLGGASVQDVNIEIYRVFPTDSGPPSGSVPTRANSPSDNTFDNRDALAGDFTFTTTILSASFSVANTVVNGIHHSPNQFTGGEGPATGVEVQLDLTLTKTLTLAAGHYFFVPQVKVSTGSFLWLSAPKPITGGTGPFTPDLQTWIRNSDLAPDWLRIGTDITHQGPFNAVFSLSGTVSSATSVPEFSGPSIVVVVIALVLLAVSRKGKLLNR